MSLLLKKLWSGRQSTQCKIRQIAMHVAITTATRAQLRLVRMVSSVSPRRVAVSVHPYRQDQAQTVVATLFSIIFRGRAISFFTYQPKRAALP